MKEFIFWFNFSAIALSFSSLAVAFISSILRKTKISFLYLLYLCCYILYCFLNLLRFFMSEYQHLSFHRLAIFGIISDYCITIIVLFIIPVFFRYVVRTVYRAWYKILQFSMMIFITGLLILALILKRYHVINAVGSLVMYLYLILISLLSITEFLKHPAKIRSPFPFPILIIYALLYIAFFLMILSNAFRPHSSAVEYPKLLFLGTKLYLWSFITIILLRDSIFNIEAEQVLSSRGEVMRKLNLTSREAEITLLLLKGLRNQEIADNLYISQRTVEKHISNIYRKCSVDSKYQLFSLFMFRQ